ncbi:MAG: hypothetical protein AABX49_02835 [Nanoarchaeota archaeon]
MVSLDAIEENLKSFISRVSKKKGKTLKKDDLRSFSIQIELLKNLIEGKGFVSQVKKLNEVKKSVLRNSIIEDEDVEKLERILNSL